MNVTTEKQEERVIALLACAGSGRRAGLPYNKLLYKVGGKAIAEYTLERFAEAHRQGIITGIAVICSENDRAEFESIAARASGVPVTVVTGGATRAQSVKNGLERLNSQGGADIVLVCDGARPNCSLDIIARCVESARVYGGAVAAVPVTDTVKTEINGAAVSGAGREGLYLAQTPQAFEFAALYEAYCAAGAAADGLTDDSGVMERFGNGKLKTRLVPGSYENYKITSAKDIRRFEAERGLRAAGSGAPCRLEQSGAGFGGGKDCGGLRIGFGSDTHRLAPGRKLVLGGKVIPHALGLQGHSDADALIHSVIDALLSAASCRDIGFYFPDTDPDSKGADSTGLLRKTAALLREKQVKVINISAVIHAERPRMGEHIPEMSKNIASALGIEPERVSVSAKTGESVGIVGEEKAIVCEAVCLISRT